MLPYSIEDYSLTGLKTGLRLSMSTSTQLCSETISISSSPAWKAQTRSNGTLMITTLSH